MDIPPGEIRPMDTGGAKEQFYYLGDGKFISKDIRFFAGHFQTKNDRLDNRRTDLAKRVQEFVDWAPHWLQEELFYTPYCEATGQMVDTPVKPQEGKPFTVSKPSIPFSEQTYGNLVGDIRWVKFMDTYKLPRERVVQAVQQVVNVIPREDATYLPWDFRQFDNSMKIGSYELALAIIPDMTDEEAKKIFANANISVGSIREKIREQHPDY